MLKDFLASLAREPFTYGHSDCAWVLGRWWELRHGDNPAAALHYATHDECLTVLAQHRGLLRLVFNLSRSVGAHRTRAPVAGDFAVVRHRGIQFGAIMGESGKWAIKCSNGLFMTRRCRVLMAWSIS